MEVPAGTAVEDRPVGGTAAETAVEGSLAGGSLAVASLAEDSLAEGSLQSQRNAVSPHPVSRGVAFDCRPQPACPATRS